MSYVYSAKNNAFFYKPELHLYENVGWDLSDIIDVSYDLFLEFTQDRNEEGVMRVAGDDGLPSWEKLPPPTHEEQIAAAELQKQRLINQANEYMNSKQWPGKAAMGRLKDAEKAQYNMWLDYLDALEAVDTFSASDINWPVPPEV
ncbi:tail fiber assembly protein [Cronobacter sakazakii]|nr:tail fiber assembly protein [Cronobacter sakazakii]HAT3761505.1 tail fiber assembly protein [Citrobacter freundii]EGT4267291.1 tail fiber assembly protein [Cronobacter sakazakii]EMD9241004.1 tail fiber assembly protein [Cronobacter sakazakii]EMD9251636.1 tail fiber assembly protein [Cronobacter sakazakii]EMD9268965.1 tail fiber assembly protein [Cronobacter sakazakii]